MGIIPDALQQIEIGLMDPIFVANEGKLIAIVPQEDTKTVLDTRTVDMQIGEQLPRIC